MREIIFRSLLTATVATCLVSRLPSTMGAWLGVAVSIVGTVCLAGGVAALLERLTARKAPERDADEDAGSPYRSQFQSGSGNVQAGGDISNADGDVAIRLDNFLVVTESLRGIGLRTDKQTLTLTHRGQTFMIRYDPRS